MGIYLENGYLNIPHIIEYGTPWNIIVGARATGKTFGALKYVLDEKQGFVYLRRTQTQLDVIKKPAFSPFNAVNNLAGYNVQPRPITKHSCGYYHCTTKDDGELEYGAFPIGYAMALSTMHNVRSISAESVEVLIYDEFIPERHAPSIRNEGGAFFNVCETISRNREITGRPPLKVLCLANSDSIANPLFIYLNLIKTVEKMKQKDQEIYVNKERGLSIILPLHSPIIEKKKDTSLYRLTRGTEFSKVALENEFTEFDYANVKSQNLKEYRPMVSIGELCIYKHKAKNVIYVSTHKSGTPRMYTTGDSDMKRFKTRYYRLWDMYMARKILFEDSTSEVLFNTYMGVLN